MTREELNKFVNDNFSPDFMCQTCEHQTDKVCDYNCSDYEISDKAWEKYSKSDELEFKVKYAKALIDNVILICEEIPGASEYLRPSIMNLIDGSCNK